MASSKKDIHQLYYSSFRENRLLMSLGKARQSLNEALGEIPINIGDVVRFTGDIVIKSVALNFERSLPQEPVRRKKR